MDRPRFLRSRLQESESAFRQGYNHVERSVYRQSLHLLETGRRSRSIFHLPKSGSKDLPTLIGTSRTTEFDDGTAVPGLVYSYLIQADGEFGSSGLSAPAKGYRKLAAPLEVDATDGEGEIQDQVTISWSGVREAGSYSVYRAAQDRGGKPKLIGTATQTRFMDGTGTPGQIYLYSVKANNEYGSSAFSPSDSGHLEILPPQGVLASDGTYTDKVQITWNEVKGITSYEVLRAEGISTFQLLGKVNKKTYYDDKTAEVGKVYLYQCQIDQCLRDERSERPGFGLPRSLGVKHFFIEKMTHGRVCSSL